MNESGTSTSAALTVTGLRKAFRVSRSAGGGAVHAVAGVDLVIGRGEIVGLVGESGSGKTTVAHCVLRLLEPDSGAIALDGTDITHLSRGKLMPLRPKMHMVFQDPYSSLNPRMKVADIIAAGIVPAAMEFMDRRCIEAVEDYCAPGYPKGAEGVLVIDADGIPSEVDDAIARIAAIARACGAELREATDEAERARLWAGRKAAFPAMGRLAPDMLPLKNQVYIATDGAKGCGARLAGVEIPKYEDVETTLPELRARVAKTIAFLKTLDRKNFAGAENKEIVLKFPNSTHEYKGGDYVNKFVLPNVYFHITTAYGILRHLGVKLGKPDYLSGGEE